MRSLVFNSEMYAPQFLVDMKKGGLLYSLVYGVETDTNWREDVK